MRKKFLCTMVIIAIVFTFLLGTAVYAEESGTDDVIIDIIKNDNVTLMCDSRLKMKKGDVKIVDVVLTNGYKIVRIDKGKNTAKWQPDIQNRNIGKLTITAVESSSFVIIAEKNSLSVKFVAGDGGTIQGNLNQTVIYGGDSENVIAKANPGYVFSSWSDGIFYEERNLENVKEDTILTAHFTPAGDSVVLHQLILVAPSGGGKGKVSNFAYTNYYYQDDTELILTAIPDNGYEFVKWETKKDGVWTDLSVNSELVFNIQRTTYIRPVFKTKSVNVNITAENGKVEISGYKRINSKIMLTAQPDDMFVFKYWTNAQGTILSTNPSVEMFLLGDVNIHAIFNVNHDIYSEVTYYSPNGFILEKFIVDKGTDFNSINPPDYKKDGWVFKEWKLSKGKLDNGLINENLEYRGIYVLDTASLKFDVNVINGTIIKGNSSVNYNTAITVSADTGAGEEFAYWINDKGKIVSFDEVFTFSVLNNTVLTAVYSDALLFGSDYASTDLTAFNFNGDYISAAGIAAVPKDYSVKDGTTNKTYKFELIACGVLTTVDSSVAGRENDFVINQKGVGFTLSNRLTASNQFIINFRNGLNLGDTWFARTYLKLKITCESVYTNESKSVTESYVDIYSDILSVRIEF